MLAVNAPALSIDNDAKLDREEYGNLELIQKPQNTQEFKIRIAA